MSATASAERVPALRERCRRITEWAGFQVAVTALIVLNAITIGLETSPSVTAAAAWWLTPLSAVIQAWFLAEIAVRMAACRPLTAFFRDGWNVFDFMVVAASLLPVAGPFATVARLARLLRVTRLVSVSPELRLIVATMLRSIPSLGHVGLLLGLLLYVYGIAGVYLFREADPSHWGSLSTALLSLFQVLTLEGWPDMQRAVIGVRPWAWVFFASFVIIAVFVVINLFIAVVLNNLENAKREVGEAADVTQAQRDALLAIARLRADLEHVEMVLRRSGPSPRSSPRGRGQRSGEDVVTAIDVANLPGDSQSRAQQV